MEPQGPPTRVEVPSEEARPVEVDRCLRGYPNGKRGPSSCTSTALSSNGTVVYCRLADCPYRPRRGGN